MARLCIAHYDLKFENKSGIYKVTGIRSLFVDEAYTLLRLLNPSQLFITDGTLSGCLERLKNNQSDISFGYHGLQVGSYYYVPDVKAAYAPSIVSGYEVDEYIRNQSNRPFSQFGLLENVKSFNCEVYATTALLFLTMILVDWLFQCLFNAQMDNIPVRSASRQRTLRMKNGHKTLKLVTHVACFLIWFPFLSLYQTTQVITQKPFVITNYESLIRSNISIYSCMTFDEAKYFAPSHRNIRNHDLTFRFFNYFKRKKFESNSCIKREGENNFINFIFKHHTLAKHIVEKDFVVIGLVKVTKYTRQRLCASSGTNEYFRIFATVDPSQREILVGNAFRVGFYDPEVRRKLRLLDSINPLSATQADYIEYMNNYLDYNFLMTKERRSQQKRFCLDEELGTPSRERTFDSDFHFFKAFLILLLCLLVCASIFLLLENFRQT